MTKIKPCPFCGEVQALEIVSRPGKQVAVACQNCLAIGAHSETRQGAVEWWNGSNAAEREAAAVQAEYHQVKCYSELAWQNDEIKKAYLEGMRQAAVDIAAAIRARGNDEQGT